VKPTVSLFAALEVLKFVESDGKIGLEYVWVDQKLALCPALDL
jgi:hypothetical protein